jgi:hypothetical protein
LSGALVTVNDGRGKGGVFPETALAIMGWQMSGNCRLAREGTLQGLLLQVRGRTKPLNFHRCYSDML